MTAFDDQLLQKALTKRDEIAEARCERWRPGECPVGIDIACEIITAVANRFDEIRFEQDAAYARGQLDQAIWLIKRHEKLAAKREEQVES